LDEGISSYKEKVEVYLSTVGYAEKDSLISLLDEGISSYKEKVLEVYLSTVGYAKEKDSLISLLDEGISSYKEKVEVYLSTVGYAEKDSLISLLDEGISSYKEKVEVYLSTVGYAEKDSLISLLDEGISSYKEKLEVYLSTVGYAKEKDSLISLLDEELDFYNYKDSLKVILQKVDLFNRDLLKSDILTELLLREKEKVVELEEFIYSELEKQMAVLSYGYTFSEKEYKSDIMSAMYQIGSKAFGVGLISEEEYLKFSKMALEEVIIVSDILSNKSDLGVQILDDIFSKQGINLTYLSKSTLTDKDLLDNMQLILNTIGGVSDTKVIIEKYISLKKDEKISILTREEVDIEIDKFKQSIYDISTLYAKGILYYDEDSLSNMSENEDYQGLGVPLRLKSKDPYNDYFSWSDYSSSLELIQNNIEGDLSFFDINKSTGIILSKSDNLFSKLISNNKSTAYRFKVDFTVEDTLDDNGVGVIVRYFNDTNYMYFIISGGDTNNTLQMQTPMQLYKIVNGVTNSIGSPMNPYYWQLGETYTIGVDVNDNRIKIWVNSNLQYDIIDS
jgi:hypothetical protein